MDNLDKIVTCSWASSLVHQGILSSAVVGPSLGNLEVAAMLFSQGSLQECSIAVDGPRLHSIC